MKSLSSHCVKFIDWKEQWKIKVDFHSLEQEMSKSVFQAKLPSVLATKYPSSFYNTARIVIVKLWMVWFFVNYTINLKYYQGKCYQKCVCCNDCSPLCVGLINDI